MPGNILVTGRPGSGKTTLVLRVLERLAARGFKAAGFVTEEIRRERRRTGFEVRDLGGRAAILAHVDRRGKHGVGRYGVDVDAFERIALHALDKGRREADLLVVDEIGRMELYSSAFRSMLLELLDSSLPLLATLHEGKDPFTAGIRSRDDVTLFRLTPEGREGLLEVIDGSLCRILKDSGVSVEPEGGKG